MTPWTEASIAKALANSDMFHYRKHFVCVPNLTGLMMWEADFIACTHSGYLTEVEIKVSASDWRNDKLKDKWKPNIYGQPRMGWRHIKNFYYCAPMELAKRWEEFGIPEYAGVLGVHTRNEYTRVDIIRPATPRKPVEKLSDKDMQALARLTAIRIWGLPDYKNDVVPNLVSALRKTANVCAGNTMTKDSLVVALEEAKDALKAYEKEHPSEEVVEVEAD